MIIIIFSSKSNAEKERKMFLEGVGESLVHLVGRWLARCRRRRRLFSVVLHTNADVKSSFI
jgi:hypothetical protein